jgi:hypothetical protein
MGLVEREHVLVLAERGGDQKGKYAPLQFGVKWVRSSGFARRISFLFVFH